MKLILDPTTGKARLEDFTADKIGAASKAQVDSQTAQITALMATIEALTQQINAPKTYDLTITNAT